MYMANPTDAPNLINRGRSLYDSDAVAIGWLSTVSIKAENSPQNVLTFFARRTSSQTKSAQESDYASYLPAATYEPCQLLPLLSAYGKTVRKRRLAVDTTSC